MARDLGERNEARVGALTHRPRNELIVGLADRFFSSAQSYLEIGCGNGAVLRALAQSRRWQRLVGSDLHPSGLANARARLPRGVEFAQMNARAIPAANTFDLTGAYDVVEHVADDEGVLRGLRRATKTGAGRSSPCLNIHGCGAALTRSGTTSDAIGSASWRRNCAATASMSCFRRRLRRCSCR
jgi:ubiquinone/menaquinone biosynthesis C-methylase UbiE